MRKLNTETIKKALKEIILKACVSISPDCENALGFAEQRETQPMAKFALNLLNKNIAAAREHNIPACQDTGMAVVFLQIGQEVLLEGEYIYDAVNSAVAQAYSQGCFRMSVLDPITRINTETNTPAVIHTEIVKGDNVKIDFLAKGFGSENMSRLYMLKPSEGIEGVKRCITDTVKEAGSNPCPPIIVGVGIGGTADKAVSIAKHSLLRDIGSKNADNELNLLENEMLEKINSLNIGVQGFKGANTALAVFIEKYPTHIAALPVAVNIQCHSVRKGGVVI